ncbi:MAG: rhodanese-like domain-containing protein [Vicinamibacterales bacterium]
MARFTARALAGVLLLAGTFQAPVLAQRAPDPVVERISIDDTVALMKKDAVLLLDVRILGLYMTEHIKGARNLPVEDADWRAEEFKGETRQIVTYCSCPEEHSAIEAAKRMIQNGVPGVKALTGGWNTWKARRLPTATGTEPGLR